MIGARNLKAPRVAAVLSIVITFATGALTGCAGSGEPTSLLFTAEELTSPPNLSIGDPAPQLVVDEWLHGEPVHQFEPGRIYAIDFWASWCGPCLAIMPHLAKVQEEFADRGVVVVALTALDEANPRRSVRAALQTLSESPKFRVAIDGGEQRAETVANYIRGTRENGIPRTFIVDQAGRLAWIGHPRDVRPVLQSMLDGDWDIVEAESRWRLHAAQRLESRALIAEWFDAKQATDLPRECELIERLARMNPAALAFSPPFHIHTRRIALRNETGDIQGAVDAARQSRSEPAFSSEPWAFAQFAFAVRPASPSLAAELATEAERQLDDYMSTPPSGDAWATFMHHAMRSWNSQAYLVLAEYYNASGNAAQALGAMERCVELSDPRYRDHHRELQQALERYRKAAAAG